MTQRVLVLDGLRGFLVVFMAWNHIWFQQGFLLGWLHFGELGFVTSAQGFIFMAGLMVGLVYGRHHLRTGFATVRDRLVRRAGVVYAWHLGLLVLLVLAIRWIPDTRGAWDAMLGALYEDGLAYALAAALLLYQPTYFDILPQYVLYLLVAPVLLHLALTGRLWLVAAVSLCAWLFVQLGGHLPLVAAIEPRLRLGETDLVLRGHFNPLAWQLLFVAGLLVGAASTTGRLDPARILRPERTELLKIALLVLAFLALWRIAISAGLPSAEMFARIQAFERRGELGPIFPIAFAASAYVVAWLLVAGPASPVALARRAAAFLEALWTHPLLVLVGRHALAVFAWHVVLVYAQILADHAWGPFADPWSSLLALLVVALLPLPALLLEARRRGLAARTALAPVRD